MEPRKTKAKASAPGLTWRGETPLWRASKSAIADGYPVKNVNLSLFADDLPRLVERCERLQAEMKAWVSGRRGQKHAFDGSIKSLILTWQQEPESSYRTIKPSTRKPYDVYAEMIITEIGNRLIDDCNGNDVKRWFASWSEPTRKNGRRHVPKARMAISILKAALTHGILNRRPGCKEFHDILSVMKFEQQPSRTAAPTADDVTKMRQGAHKKGHSAAALAYAMQFDGAIRQYDVIGEWIPMDDPRPSLIHDNGMKWIGPMWANIDENMIFRYEPTKTAGTTGARVAIDLSCLPMVVEELSHVSQEARKGPLIVNPATGLPYRSVYFQWLWRLVRKAEGVSEDIWNRDLRAGGITEGRAAAATNDDLSKVAGHSSKRTTAKVYDRASLEAARRVAEVRATHRAKRPE